MIRPGQSFDYYIRSATTALLALGLVAAAVYALLFRTMVSTALTGWAGIVVGVYFGSHTTINGWRARGQALTQDETVTEKSGSAAPGSKA